MRSNNTNGVLQPPSVGLWQAARFKENGIIWAATG